MSNRLRYRNGEPWGERQIDFWRSWQDPHRSYEDDVVNPLKSLSDQFNVVRYGQLQYGDQSYDLSAVRVGEWSNDKPIIIVTGGVHGYETSGVQGAMKFLQTDALSYADRFNMVVVPCVSPWSYETYNRWNPNAQDPNRGFIPNSDVPECRALYDYLRDEVQGKAHKGEILAHIDLHEATNSDPQIFEPLKAMRNGETFEIGSRIPDGFFLIEDEHHSNPALESAVIDAVSKMARIAPQEADGTIYDAPVKQEGVIYTDIKGIAGLATNPKVVLTTEMYGGRGYSLDPEDKKAQKRRDEQNIDVQITALKAALDHLDMNGPG